MKKTFDEKKQIDCTYSISEITPQFHENSLAENISYIVYLVFIFIYRRPTLYPLEIAVDFLKSL